ncbi:calcitonin gene-related peptide type 1 receptor isoform X2 [Folsomia candida]|uniref:calcitonin gene-related peptide type 1 receptor isoform X2 n=1 Tax=Folsomia candida TaxID=158441 RepID=UPI001604C9F8|nr:calcitonin gene-related peptide type 1 receptor isoform X2 [Folsomia candida]
MHPRVPSTMLNTSITSPEVSASNISPEAEEGDNNRDEIVAIANEQLSIFQKLMQGSWLEHQCLDGHVATNSTSQNQQLMCPRTFDGWSCWNETPAGMLSYNSCPAFVLGFDSSKYGFKECLEDGTWFKHPQSNMTWSNYTDCVNSEEYQWRNFIVSLNEIGYVISVVALIISLLIFCGFKCLECTRVRIHKHLFVSFIINNLLWLAWYTFVTGSPSTLLKEPWWCKGLHITVQYFLIANYLWMFCEGFYLHTLLVFAFIRSDSELLRGFYVFGWLGPIIPISAYAGLRIYDSHEDLAPCWTMDSKWSLVLAVPVVMSLGLNLGFLCNILRVLITKLNDSQRSFNNVTRRNSSIIAPDSQYSLKKAVRATLILIPLLGLHYLLIPIRPAKGTNWEAIYDIVAACSSSLQGLCVSVLFCFCNSEVLLVFRRKIWSRFSRDDDASPGHNRDDAADTSGPLPTSMSVLVIRSDPGENQVESQWRRCQPNSEREMY